MKPPIPAALWRLDQYLVENHPVLWILRMHWMVSAWLFGVVLIALAALAFPLTAWTLGIFDLGFGTVLIPAFIVWMTWAQDQMRGAAQMREIRPARAGVYLLAGSLFVSALLLAWPYAFVTILEARIAERAGKREVAEAWSVISVVRETASGRARARPPGLPRCVLVESRLSAPKLKLSEEEVRRVRNFQELFERFGMPPPGGALVSLNGEEVTCADAVRIRMSFWADDEMGAAYDSIAAIVGEDGRTGRSSGLRSEFHRYAFFPIGWLLLLSVIFLRILESAGTRSFLSAALSLCALLAPLALPERSLTLLGTALLGAAGAAAVFLAPRLRRKRSTVVAGIHLFTFVVVLAPGWIWIALTPPAALRANPWDPGLHVLWGLALLLLLTPWIERAYIGYQTAPE